MQDQSAGGTVTANGRLAIRSVERIETPVSGMTCAACLSYVQRTLIADPAVVDASVNLMLHNASVTFFGCNRTSFCNADAVSPFARLSNVLPIRTMAMIAPDVYYEAGILIHDLPRLVICGDANVSGSLLARRNSLIGRLDAVVHGVANHVEQWV